MILPVTLRRAVRRDIPAIVSVVSDSWHATYDPILGRERAASILAVWGTVDAWETTIPGNSIGIVGVAEHAGAIVAMTSARMQTAFDLSLQMLYVHPHHLRRGIGRRLIDFAAEPFASARCIDVEVLADNAAAIAFYRALGFAGDGCVANAAETGVPALRMRRDLRPRVRFAVSLNALLRGR